MFTNFALPLILIKVTAFIIGFLFFATILINVLTALYNLIFAEKYGFKVRTFNLFGLIFSKNDNYWIKKFNKLTPFCHCNLTLDLDKPLPKDTLKTQRRLVYSERFTTFLICILINASMYNQFISLYKGETLSLTEIFLLGFSTGMLFHSFLHIGASVYLFEIMGKGFLGYLQNKYDMTKYCERFEYLDLDPIEKLPYKPKLDCEILLYNLLYVHYLYSINKIEEIKKISHEMTDIVWERDYLLPETGVYYWLIFYYSEIEPSKELAEKFREKIWASLSKDPDSNSKRVLAYYFYRLYNDEAKAKALIDDGLSAIDKFSMGAERTFEKELLLKLKNEIESKPIDF